MDAMGVPSVVELLASVPCLHSGGNLFTQSHASRVITEQATSNFVHAIESYIARDNNNNSAIPGSSLCARNCSL